MINYKLFEPQIMEKFHLGMVGRIDLEPINGIPAHVFSGIGNSFVNESGLKLIVDDKVSMGFRIHDGQIDWLTDFLRLGGSGRMRVYESQLYGDDMPLAQYFFNAKLGGVIDTLDEARMVQAVIIELICS